MLYNLKNSNNTKATLIYYYHIIIELSLAIIIITISADLCQNAMNIVFVCKVWLSYGGSRLSQTIL